MDTIIEVPSNVANTVNFVIFEVLLISVVFFLTTDISGRLNYLSLISGEDKPLIVFSPPILGGGVCSTSFARAFIMILIRAGAVLAIFGTALTIDGESKAFVNTREASVLVPGPIGNMSSELFKDAMSERTRCQVTEEGFIYHGLLYSNNVCEYDVRVLQDQIRISTTAESVSISLRNCTMKKQKKQRRGFIEYYRCSNALVSCTISGSGERLPQWCRGILQTETGEYMCSSFASREGRNWTARCQRSFNIKQVKDYWLDAWSISGRSLSEMIGACSILGQETKKVKYIENRNVTNVNKMWFAIFALKIVVMMGLTCFALLLRTRGAMCILNDENGLVQLLRRSISFGLSDEEFKIYLHHSKTGKGTRFWASKSPQKKDRNVNIHEEESKFY